MRGEGYTKLPNSVLQVLAFVKLAPRVLKTFFAIYRFTLGWQTPEKVLSYDHVRLMTGLRRSDQYRAIKTALDLNMIKRYNLRSESEETKRPVYCYSVNLDPKSWKVKAETSAEHMIRLWKGLMSAKPQTKMSAKLQTKMSAKLQTNVIDLLTDNQIK